MTADELLPATRRALARRVAAGQAEGQTPSLVGAVVRDGRQVWCGSRSMLDGHEPDGGTQYRIGSLTKTFVAVLVMRLRDEGRLDLADPLTAYLDGPEVPDVTIAQLLSHTAGLASETPGPWWERTPGDLRPGLADVLGPRPHPAGRRFHEPRFPARWAPLPDPDENLLALTGLWYWGPWPYVLRLLADAGLELSPAAGRGRASRFRAGPGGTWTGLHGYYQGETLRAVPGPDGRPEHVDLGTFVFTRQPYGPGSPPAARPDPGGWQADETSDV